MSELRLAELGELSDRELEKLRMSAEEATAKLDGREPMNVVTTGDGMGTLDFLRQDVELYERVTAALGRAG